MPTKLCVHAFHINPYLHEYFEAVVLYLHVLVKGNLSCTTNNNDSHFLGIKSYLVVLYNGKQREMAASQG